jgi:hypothetical protein
VIGNRARVLVGWDAKLLDLMVRISGSRYQRVVAAVSRRAQPAPVPIPESAPTRVNAKAKTSA